MHETHRLEEYYFFERDWDSHDDLRESFEWNVPDQFNIAEYTCDRWAEDEDRVALYAVDDTGQEEVYTFADVRDDANRLANYLADAGVSPGDRVGVYLPPKPETAITHLAAWKIGAATVPLSPLFGPDAVQYRLSSCGVEACILDGSVADAYQTATESIDVGTSLAVGDADLPSFWDALDGQRSKFDTVSTSPEDDALIMYTSGTTGPPKGVRHAHRLLLGHLPGIALTLLNMEVNEDDVAHSVAEWSWMGGLFVSLLSPWFYGIPVVSHDGGKFDPEETLALIEEYDVTLFYGLSRVYDMMHAAVEADAHEVDSVRSIFNAGGKITGETAAWMREAFDAPVYNGFGQTESNMVLSESRLFETDFESTTGEAFHPIVGKPAPGHTVELLDLDTSEPTVSTDELGEIAVRYEGDPVCLKGYFGGEVRVADTLVDGWWLTGDVGTRDSSGRFVYAGRKDQVINYSGYRIGPGEIETCLEHHADVDECAVVGVAHDEKWEVPKAFVVASEAAASDPDRTVDSLQSHVRENLAKYKYPKEIELVSELPKTTTGKIDRATLAED